MLITDSPDTSSASSLVIVCDVSKNSVELKDVSANENKTLRPIVAVEISIKRDGERPRRFVKISVIVFVNSGKLMESALGAKSKVLSVVKASEYGSEFGNNPTARNVKPAARAVMLPCLNESPNITLMSPAVTFRTTSM